MKFGEILIVDQPELTNWTQEAASAWHGVMLGEILGASYKPTNYIGGRPVKGIDHIFYAEQTLVLAIPEKHMVRITINEFNGNYNLVGIERID